MQIIRLPRGYTFAQFSLRGQLAVVIPPFETDINVNYSSVPPIVHVKVEQPMMVVQKFTTSYSDRFTFYSIDKIGGRMMASAFGLANIYPDGKVCWGRGNSVPNDVVDAWDRYWNSPFNMDLTSNNIANLVSQAIEAWRRDEWPVILATLKSRKKPKWRGGKILVPSLLYEKKMLPRANRWSRWMSNLSNVIQRTRRDIDVVDPISRIPMMKQLDKANALYRTLQAKLQKYQEEQQRLNHQYINLSAYYQRVDMQRKSRWKLADRELEFRPRILAALKDPAWKFAIHRIVYERRAINVEGFIEQQRRTLEREVHDKASKTAALDHFTKGWTRLHSYRWSVRDIAGDQALTVPQGMDFMAFMQAAKAPPFLQEILQQVSASIPYPMKHRHNRDYCDVDNCHMEWDYNNNVLCYYGYGKRIDDDISVVNFGGQTFYVKGEAIVRSETFNADPAIFEKMPAALKPSETFAEPEEPPEEPPDFDDEPDRDDDEDRG